MILKHFPGQVENHQKEDVFSCFHRENVVIYAKSSEIAYSEHSAPLSIKSCLEGTEFYEMRGVPIAVQENKYLVINNHQPYSSQILAHQPVESFCVFFRDGLETQTLAAFEQTAENLLDNPEGNGNWSVPFFQNLRRPDSMISPLLIKLHDGISKGNFSQLWLDEQSSDLMEVLILEHKQTLKKIETFSMIRPSTKIETYKRLCLARDFIESCYDEPVDLKKLANVACLSPHHFLRSFKSIFHQTPHQYLINVRLQKALQLVKKENHSITRICFSVGFENLSSFIRLFKKRFKVSPLELRRRRFNS